MSNKTDRTFKCPRCQVEYLETDKSVTKCICPTDKCEMIEIKEKGGQHG